MTLFDDPKYDVDDETAKLPSTVEFNPDMAQFESDQVCPTSSPGPSTSNWSRVRIGTFRSRLETMQHSNDSKGFRRISNLLDSLSSGQVYGLANEVFGYNGWSSTIMHYEELSDDFDDEKGRYSLKSRAIVRVFLKDGFYYDHLGMGEAINLPHKYMCYSNCRKQATTDATKRALVAIGDVHSPSDSIKTEIESKIAMT